MYDIIAFSFALLAAGFLGLAAFAPGTYSSYAKKWLWFLGGVFAVILVLMYGISALMWLTEELAAGELPNVGGWASRSVALTSIGVLAFIMVLALLIWQRDRVRAILIWQYLCAILLMLLGFTVAYMSGMLPSWAAFTGTWGAPSIPRISAWVWSYPLQLGVEAAIIIAIVYLLAPTFTKHFAYIVGLVAFLFFIVGPIGAWAANDFAGQRAHWYGTAPTAPPVLPSHHRVSIDATTGRSAPIKVPPGKTVRTLQLASMELHGVLEDGRDLTAFKNWPIDTPGHYQCFPIKYAYVLDLERRATSVEYWYEDYPCPK